MMTLLIDSAIRSLAFAAAVAAMLWVLRVRSVTIRMAAWTVVLFGALLLPIAAPMMPPLRIPVAEAAIGEPVTILPTVVISMATRRIPARHAPAGFDWPQAVETFYLVAAACLLGRLTFGWLVSRRVLRSSEPVSDPRVLEVLDAQSRLAELASTPSIRQSAALAVPITLGWRKPSITLPDSWREWDRAKLAAVLAHELSHIRRGDYAVLFLSSIYRAIFWFNPLGWWLDKHLRELAEQASDEWALHTTEDRTQYAEILLGFFEALQQQRSRIRWQRLGGHGVAMARGARAGRRIDRILAFDRRISTPARRPVMAGFAILAVPLFYFCGSLHPVAIAQAAASAGSRAVSPASSASAQSTSQGAGRAYSFGRESYSDDDSTSSSRESHAKTDDSYIIVSGDVTTMSGSSRDLAHAMARRAELGDDFIWFRRNGKSYIIRDADFLREAHKLFAPQQELGRKQGELGDEQAKLGDQQAKLGDQQSAVRTTPPDLTREIELLKEKLKSAGTSEELGDVQALLGELQSKVAAAQERIGDEQAKLGDQQSKLGDQQAELGRKQAELGEEQARAAEEATRKLKRMIDDAFKKGIVQPDSH